MKTIRGSAFAGFTGFTGCIALVASFLGSGALHADPATPGALVSIATPADLEAIRDGVGRSVVDPGLADVFDREPKARVRIIAVFERTPGRAPSRGPDLARARLIGEGLLPGRRFGVLPVLIGSVDAHALARLIDDPAIVRVGVDGLSRAQLAESLPLVNLDVMNAANYDGTGALVAIVDTGIDLDHPDLVDAIVDERCFCDDELPGVFGCCPNGMNEQSGSGAGQDDHGHGTRVSGVVSSGGVHAVPGGAPESGLLAVKVLSSAGTGLGSDILAGLDWVLAAHPETDVVNISLGFGLYAGNCDNADASTTAFASAVDLLHASGVLVVAGSGNNRSTTSMIAPACVASAVSVGAVWDADNGPRTNLGCTDATTAPDQVTCWSNSSTTTDVLAPGGRIRSSTLDGTTANVTGTSYATPHVSACAAVLAVAHPGASTDDLVAALTTSPVHPVDAKNGLDYPRLDCKAAHFALVPQAPAAGDGARATLVLVLIGIGAIFLARRRAAVL
jgi:subtilisin family serine protease